MWTVIGMILSSFPALGHTPRLGRYAHGRGNMEVCARKHNELLHLHFYVIFYIFKEVTVESSTVEKSFLFFRYPDTRISRMKPFKKDTNARIYKYANPRTLFIFSKPLQTHRFLYEHTVLVEWKHVLHYVKSYISLSKNICFIEWRRTIHWMNS